MLLMLAGIIIYILGVIILRNFLMGAVKILDKRPSKRTKIIVTLVSMLSWLLIIVTLIASIVLYLIDKVLILKKSDNLKKILKLWKRS